MAEKVSQQVANEFVTLFIIMWIIHVELIRINKKYTIVELKVDLLTID